MSNELQKAESRVAPAPAQSPADLMQMAIANGVTDFSGLEKMMELQERYERREAQKAYVKAMSAFKADPPRIVKDKEVKFNSTHYNHASLANVTNQINGALSRHGLSSGWSTSQENGLVSVTCTITHELGHSESTTLSSSPDQSGGKNSIQAIGSAVSYLERYTVLALTGLATHENDDDGKPVATISPEQVAELDALINERGIDRARFYAVAGITDLSQLWESSFARAKTDLMRSGGAK